MNAAELLRLATEDDAAAILEIYAPIVRDTAISFELEPPGLDEMRRRIRTTLEQYPWLVAEGEAQILGYAYASAFRPRPAYQWTAEVAIYVRSEARGRGVGRALLAKLTDLLQRQGYRSAIGGIALPNDASIALHEALGFERIALLPEVGFKHGAWHDVGYWQLRYASRPGGEPPRPISAVPLS